MLNYKPFHVYTSFLNSLARPLCLSFSLIFITNCSVQTEGDQQTSFNAKSSDAEVDLDGQSSAVSPDELDSSDASDESMINLEDHIEAPIQANPAIEEGSSEGAQESAEPPLDGSLGEVINPEEVSEENENNEPATEPTAEVPKQEVACIPPSEGTEYMRRFTAEQADPDANLNVLPGRFQQAYLNTNDAKKVENSCGLVVYLHGGGMPAENQSCFGSEETLKVLGSQGHHVLIPCYYSYYGINNCGDKFGECRLEAIEGEDHSDDIVVSKADALETRIVKALDYLQAQHPEGNWEQFIEVVGNQSKPKWSEIIIAGGSHGGSSSGIIAKTREVRRAVMFSGPLDSGQDWLVNGESKTKVENMFAVTCNSDRQHQGHLQSFLDLKIPGVPMSFQNQNLQQLNAAKANSFILGAPCAHATTGPRVSAQTWVNGVSIYNELYQYLFSASRNVAPEVVE